MTAGGDGFSSYAAFRQGYVCAGAAAENLRIALCHAGFSGSLALLPDRADPLLLAVLRPSDRAIPSAEDEALFAVLSRPLSASPLGRRRGTVAPALLALFRHVAREHGAWLDVIADGRRRRRLEALVAEASQVTGAPGPSILPSPAAAPSARFGSTPSEQSAFTRIIGALGSSITNSADDLADPPEASERARVTEAPLLLILGTHGDRPLDWLLAGQALQHVLLHASMHGLATTFLNEPLRHAPLRDGIRAVAGHGEPQVIARLDFSASNGDCLPLATISQVH